MDASLMSSFILIIILKFPSYKFSAGKKLSHFCNIEFWMNRSEICVKFAVKILKKLLYVIYLTLAKKCHINLDERIVPMSVLQEKSIIHPTDPKKLQPRRMAFE